MIVLDTHIWVWWVHGDERLTSNQLEVIQANEDGVIGISAISLWEIAKLVENGRLELPISLEKWGGGFA
jgi:PIN domain nuclease of toxin-antitoxin system